MIANGASVAVTRDGDDKTPAELAGEARHIDLANWLLAVGIGDPSIVWGFMSQEDINRCLLDLLHRGGDANYDSIKELISRYGANVNYKDKFFSDKTPLHIAVHYGDVKVSRLLVENGANINERDSGSLPHFMRVLVGVSK